MLKLTFYMLKSTGFCLDGYEYTKGVEENYFLGKFINQVVK